MKHDASDRLIMRDIISRFAPAPTGFLHLGHVVNAVLVWRETRARHGRVLLRIEDHDRQRSRRVFEDAMLDDLATTAFAAGNHDALKMCTA